MPTHLQEVQVYEEELNTHVQLAAGRLQLVRTMPEYVRATVHHQLVRTVAVLTVLLRVAVAHVAAVRTTLHRLALVALIQAAVHSLVEAVVVEDSAAEAAIWVAAAVVAAVVVVDRHDIANRQTDYNS